MLTKTQSQQHSHFLPGRGLFYNSEWGVTIPPAFSLPAEPSFCHRNPFQKCSQDVLPLVWSMVDHKPVGLILDLRIAQNSIGESLITSIFMFYYLLLMSSVTALCL